MMVIKLQLILIVSRQFVPSVGGKEEYVADSVDPLSEDEYIVSPQCIHKYEDRVLIWVCNVYFANCRLCTRRRLIKKRESIIFDILDKSGLLVLGMI